MGLKKRDILKYELIGTEVEVIDAKNRYNIGIKGKVIDETKNTLVIETAKGRKRIIKQNAVFLFNFKTKKVKIDGKLLVGRPEERLKREIKNG